MSKFLISLTDIDLPLSSQKIANSDKFLKFLKSYFQENEKDSQPNSEFFHFYKADRLVDFIKRIVNKDSQTLESISNLSEQKKDDMINFIDSIYDYWRSLERYVFLDADKNNIKNKDFLHLFQEFASSIVSFYREIYETIINQEQTVYRILPSGGNAGIFLSKSHLSLPSSLSFLNEVKAMKCVVTHPPFIIRTKENKRRGTFFYQDRKVHPDNFDYKNAYAVIINIYDTRGVIYFTKEYLGFLVSLGNLFQLETLSDNVEHIDFAVLFGTQGIENDCYYYKEDGIYVGVLPKESHIDYFGYAKKMVLTLFNLVMIDRKLLPIHGAGIKIRRENKHKNFFILGDSGAGKSETIEAIRMLYNQDYQIDTIFDDMGTFHLIDGKVYATGTEIGAFVRLDDLDQGYSLRSADRAVFLNIEQENSRVVIPIEDFEMTYTHHPVDVFLLADNYTPSEDGIEFYDDLNIAMTDFILGRRVALNTTSESGLVSTFFANPFGPLQRKDEVKKYLPDYFKALNDNKVPIGKLYTRLSLDRKEGPYSGAKALIDLFEKI